MGSTLLSLTFPSLALCHSCHPAMHHDSSLPPPRSSSHLRAAILLCLATHGQQGVTWQCVFSCLILYVCCVLSLLFMVDGMAWVDVALNLRTHHLPHTPHTSTLPCAPPTFSTRRLLASTELPRIGIPTHTARWRRIDNTCGEGAALHFHCWGAASLPRVWLATSPTRKRRRATCLPLCLQGRCHGAATNTPPTT